MLSSWIQSRKLTITIKSILLFQSIKKVLPSSLLGSCNIVICQVPIVDSEFPCGGAIAASFSSRFFLSSHIPSHPFFLDIIEKTYNLEPPISIYLKKCLPLPPCVVRIVMENTLHSLVFFDGVLPCCLVEAKKSGGGDVPATIGQDKLRATGTTGNLRTNQSSSPTTSVHAG
jgi:hypothetical protein